MKKMVLRPPASRMKNVLGIRSVAPDKPATAVRENSSDLVYGNPRFSICTVMIPQYSHTAKPHSRLGIEIHRLRVAIALPVAAHSCGSSGFHFRMSLAMSCS